MLVATALVGASLVAQLVKNLPVMQETWVRSLGWKEPPGEGKGYPLQYSGLKNSMDCIVHEVAKSQAQLKDFHSLTDCIGGRHGWTWKGYSQSKVQARSSALNGYHCSHYSM